MNQCILEKFYMWLILFLKVTEYCCFVASTAIHMLVSPDMKIINCEA